MDRMLLEIQKLAGYQENLTTLELKVGVLEAKKGRLEAVEALLRQEVKAVKCDRAKLVSKVVPYVAMELLQSDEMEMLVGNLLSSAIFYRRCATFEEVASMKEPFDLEKVKCYRPSYKKDYTKAGNDLVIATFSFLSKVIADPSASVEALLSKNPKSLYRPTLTKTHAPALSAPSQKAIPSSTPTLKPLPANNASYSASLLVVSKSDLRVYVYCFPSRLTNIRPELEPSNLEAPSVYNFHVLPKCNTSFAASISLVYETLSTTKGVSARKSASNTSNQLKQEEQDSSQHWKPPVYYSDDDDDFFRESIDETPPSNAIAPDLPITDSLVMEDEHLNTTPETDSDEEIESSVKNLNLTLSESEDLSDYVSECDFPFCDNSPNFNNDYEIFSNPLFDSNDDYTSSNDESFSEENVLIENFKIYSNPLLEFDEEIFSSEFNPLYNEVLEDIDLILPRNENDHFNAESDLIESMLNKDTVITSPKINFLLEEFTELNSENDFEKENSGSTTIHIDISLPDYESFDDERDSASKIFNDDLAHIISPSEYEYVYAYDEFDSGDLTTKVVDDIYDNLTRELYVHVPNVLTILPTLYPVFDTLLPLSSENKDKYPVIRQPRQEMSTRMFLAKEKLIKAIQTCLKNNNQPPEEKSIVVLLAEESILTVMQTLEEKQIDTEKSIDETPPSDAIAPDLPITDSLVMEDEHLNTTPEMDSDEEIESSVKNLNLTLSESEDLSDYVNECDLPFCDNSPDFNNDSEIFSNPLFDSNDDYTSSDDESFSEENVLVENFKIYSNPLLEFDEEIFSSEFNPLCNKVLEDLDSIPPGNENDYFNAESDLIKSMLNKDTVITSPKINFLLQEFVEELNFENDFEKENSGSDTIHIDIYLPDYESFDDESDSASEILTMILLTSYLHRMFDTLLPFSSKNKDKVFNPGILISKEEKSPPFLSHRGLKVFQLINDSESPMMIYGGDIQILDVPYLHFYPP
nr:hypothetical protein [Tanacetum cinerariifolium]